jgi:hypothetical protein
MEAKSNTKRGGNCRESFNITRRMVAYREAESS